MNKILSTLTLALTLSAAGAFAASHTGAPMAGASGAKKAPSAAQQAQQDKMKACNADTKAKTLKGDERKKFMSECLSADAKPAATAQQTKMTTCNADQKAKTLKGDERKKFMSECLKG
jgi:psiF repeat